MQIDRSLLPPAIFGGLIAIGLIGAGLAIGGGVINAQVGNRQVNVRGVAEKNVVADLAVLTLRFTTSGDDLDTLKAKIDGDLVKVRGFLAAQGYPEAAITVGRLEVTDLKAQAYQPQPDLPKYSVGQGVTVRTNDVGRVARTDRALDQLVRQDVLLDFTAPTYVFTRLNEVRPAMIAEATASARSGAEQFAQDSGAPLGPIRQATQGSFEILAREDIDSEPTSLNKRVRVVATVTYQLK
ncbi:SIMPL domain-containing protein [Brevundimonas sp. LM2]|uniref:SIMPL domain-containing protein n=1 Tax=Brevundimonas sp. LM2 TaxID=1938605 RepID=UPI000983FB0E|nr:SIMPL domain-containing protein [Brevundimonas sp. LM2]AQR61793.1 SIMPL domain-containing protein [Brevundimonas sp. LM2]